jgi:tRNA G10  N-methylase Trm11
MIGSDIDMRVLTGSGVGHLNKATPGYTQPDIYTNFKHYNLPLPDFIAMDLSAL